jgi:hypothetical protein
MGFVDYVWTSVLVYSFLGVWTNITTTAGICDEERSDEWQLHAHHVLKSQQNKHLTTEFGFIVNP